MDLCIKEIIKDSKQTLSLGWLKAPPKDPDWSQTYTQREVQKLTLVNSYPELISCLATKDNFIGVGHNQSIQRTAEAMAGVLSNLEDVVVAEPIIRVAMECINIIITCMTHRQNSMAHLVVYAAVLIIPLSTVTRENMT